MIPFLFVNIFYTKRGGSFFEYTASKNIAANIAMLSPKEQFKIPHRLYFNIKILL